jgi:hypothetical protein
MKKPLSCGLVSIAALAGLLPGLAQAQGDDLARLAWLAGCWKSDTAEAGSMEQWMPPAGGTCWAWAARSGRAARWNSNSCRSGWWTASSPTSPSLPGSPPPRSRCCALGDAEATFENPQHDFPQRVIYQLAAGGKLKARIEGLRGGALRVIEFPMTRVSCDGPDGNLATR